MKTAIIILSVVLSAASLAQEQGKDSLRTYHLGEVVVMASPTTLTKVSTIADISSQVLRRSDEYAIVNALTGIAGMHLRENSRNEVVVSLRGFDQRQIGIFLDGVPLSLPYDGLVDLSNLPTMMFEKVALTKGMASFLYGTNTMGGTVNLVTREIHEGYATEIDVKYGPTSSLGVSTGGSVNQFFWQAAATYHTSDGYSLSGSFPSLPNENGGIRENSARRGHAVLLKAGGALWEHSKTVFSLLRAKNVKGVPPHALTSRPRYWRFTDWQKSLAILHHQSLFGPLVVKGNLFYEVYDNVLDSFDDATYTAQTKPYAFHSTFDDHSLGGSLSIMLAQFLSLPTRAAVSYRRDIHRERGSSSSPWQRFETESFTAGLEQELPLPYGLESVVGISRNSMIPLFADGQALRSGASSWEAYAGMAWHTSDIAIVHVHATTKSRFPTLKEIYSEVLGKNVANPNLLPETALNIEAGITLYPSSRTTTSLNLFRSNVTDLVQIIPLRAGLQQFQNIGRACFEGAEWTIGVQISGMSVGCQYTYLSAENRSPGAASHLLEYRPRHTAFIRIQALPETKLSWQVESEYCRLRHGVNIDSREWERLADYVLFHARVSYPILSFIELSVRINNLLDRQYESELGYPQAGRNVIAGVKAQF
ncbi:MAG: TonB-dependent receptor [Bacteroidota bacterium]